MELFIPFALKSLLIAAVTLGILHLLRGRSAAERSMVAHFGLLALLMVPLGTLLLPQLVIEAPLPEAAPTPPAVAPELRSATETVPAAIGPSAAPPVADSFDPLMLWPLLYGFPAAVLLAVTLLAVLRLLALRTRASVLVEPTWLSALAHAQRRMNIKGGTALLTSSELKSPISWGVLRPVILLNDGALEARHEAEAIIAHELAHVRGLDWVKLILSRVVTAIFWFNPLVWVLAREAHQLREEAADDAVLAADIAGTDYAQLLVGVARHECRGLLLASHGVAPGKGSLARRVRRVLDGSLPRTPVARGFAAGLSLGVIATAAPLAAVTLVPRGQAADANSRAHLSASQPSTSLPSLVANSVAEATALTSEVVSARVGAMKEEKARLSVQGARQQVAEAQAQAAAAAAASASARHASDQAENRARLALRVNPLGITPEYAAQIRAAAPGLRIDDDDLASLRAMEVTPEWLSGMKRAGYRARDVGDLVGARAVGLSPAYVRDLAAAGYRGIPLGELKGLRALGITGNYIRGLRARGITGLSVDELMELRALGVAAPPPRQRSSWPPGPRGRVGPGPVGPSFDAEAEAEAEAEAALEIDDHHHDDHGE